MTAPVRLQLSRRKGFSLQAMSREANGLEAVKVDRATKWGNPFVCHTDRMENGQRFPMDAKLAVVSFRRTIEQVGGWWSAPMPWPKGKIPAGEPTTVDDVKRELRGKNLCCWCALDTPCHADVLLEIANR